MKPHSGTPINGRRHVAASANSGCSSFISLKHNGAFQTAKILNAAVYDVRLSIRRPVPLGSEVALIFDEDVRVTSEHHYGVVHWLKSTPEGFEIGIAMSQFAPRHQPSPGEFSRRRLRYDCQVKGHLQVPGRPPCTFAAQDYSRRGFCIRTQERPNIGSPLLVLPEHATEKLPATVRWIKNNGYDISVGCEMDAINPCLYPLSNVKIRERQRS